MTLCLMKDFSKDIQELIRKQLAGIYHGFGDVEESPDIYSYPKTLATFLDRYRTKSDDTKKGMIGELLAHVLINNLNNDLASLSVLKNKEERSIKKGFDIIYFESANKRLWYAECKSGASETGSHTSDEYNLVLLKRADTGIQEMFETKRDSLWDSALVDVTIAIPDKPKRIDLRKILENDAPRSAGKTPAKKNVILVSVLYHKLSDKVTLAGMRSFYQDVVTKTIFGNVILFSIQKSTFDKVAKFLESESRT